MSVSRKLCIGAAARLPGLGRVQLSVMCGCERCGGAVVLLQTAAAAAVGTGDLDQWEQWDNPDRELRSFWNSGA